MKWNKNKSVLDGTFTKMPSSVVEKMDMIRLEIKCTGSKGSWEFELLKIYRSFVGAYIGKMILMFMVKNYMIKIEIN